MFNTDDDYTKFKSDIYGLTKIDLNAYKEKQMKRRIDTLISKHKYNGYNAFVDAIKTNPLLFKEFVNYLTINVSEFYRSPEQWQYLEDKVFPNLISNSDMELRYGVQPAQPEMNHIHWLCC